MPFDGSGNYIPAAAPAFPAVAGTVIDATYFNAVINDLSNALSLCITRDGQGKPTGAINWNNQNLAGVNTLGVVDLNASDAITTKDLTVTGTLTLTTRLTPVAGGTGLDGSAAANGKLLIGNGAGFSLANIVPGAGITVTNGAGTITIAATGGGGSGVTSFPLTLNNSGAGVASGATFDGSAAKTLSYNTIGAKPNTPQIQALASNATVTPTFSNDQVSITALATNITLANPTGTALDGWGIVIRIKDNGTARTISFGTQYRAVGTTLPTTTVISKVLYIGMIYNSAETKWDVVSVIQQ